METSGEEGKPTVEEWLPELSGMDLDPWLEVVYSLQYKNRPMVRLSGMSDLGVS